MSRVCELTGKSKLRANKVSHSNIKTRRPKYPSLVKRKWFINELGKSLSLKLSASALRTISARGGIENAILGEHEGNLSDRLLDVRRQIQKARQEGRRPVHKAQIKPAAPAQDVATKEV